MQTGMSELESQYQRIKQQLSFLANLLKKYPVEYSADSEPVIPLIVSH
jgi:hypothetical protein